jgi:hypothetical protein
MLWVGFYVESLALFAFVLRPTHEISLGCGRKKGTLLSEPGSAAELHRANRWEDRWGLGAETPLKFGLI